MIKNILNEQKRYMKMKERHYELVEKLKQQSQILINLENEKGSIDACADTTAEMLIAVLMHWHQMKNYETIVNKDALSRHYYLGKLINRFL